MPIVKWWGETAKSAGLSQDQYDNGVKAFIDNAVANLPNPEIEKHSGQVMYLENRAVIDRASAQIEDIKLVIEF